MSAETRLEFDQVSKWYGTVSALVDVGFSIGQEVVGLVGRNGAGKSTLMKLAAGLLRPSIGRVRVAGELAGTRAANQALGFSPDFERLYEGISGREFVTWMLRLHGVSRREAYDRAGELLTDLGLGENMHRRIAEYSKGMRQRVRLAQALAHGPGFLLLDERGNLEMDEHLRNESFFPQAYELPLFLGDHEGVSAAGLERLQRAVQPDLDGAAQRPPALFTVRRVDKHWHDGSTRQ